MLPHGLSYKLHRLKGRCCRPSQLSVYTFTDTTYKVNPSSTTPYDAADCTGAAVIFQLLGIVAFVPVEEFDGASGGGQKTSCTALATTSHLSQQLVGARYEVASSVIVL